MTADPTQAIADLRSPTTAVPGAAPLAPTPIAAPKLTRLHAAKTPADADRPIPGPFAALATSAIAPRKPSRAAPSSAKSP